MNREQISTSEDLDRIAVVVGGVIGSLTIEAIGVSKILFTDDTWKESLPYMIAGVAVAIVTEGHRRFTK